MTKAAEGSWARGHGGGRPLVGLVALAGLLVGAGCQPAAPSAGAGAAGAAAAPTTGSGTETAVPESAADEANGASAAADSARPDANPAGSPSTASEQPAGARPGPSQGARPPVRPVARRPAAPGQPLEISFDDLVIGMQQDVVFREWMMTDRAKELDGQLVRVVGYLHGGSGKLKHLRELVLLRNKECKFGQGGQADHLIRVTLKPGLTVDYSDNAFEVQGILKVNPWQGPDGNTWSLYDLEGTACKDLRRR